MTVKMTETAVRSQLALQRMPKIIEVKRPAILDGMACLGRPSPSVESPWPQSRKPNYDITSIGPCRGESLTGYLYCRIMSARLNMMAVILPVQSSAM